MIYVFLASFLLMVMSFLWLRQKEVLYFFSYVLLILIIFFMGTRYGVGNDYFGLIDLYEGYVNQFGIRLREPLFYFIAEIDFLFEGKGLLLVFLYTLITYSLIFYASNSYKIRLYSLSFMFLSGFIFFSIDQVRQALGFSIIFFLTVKAFDSKNINNFNLKFFFAILLASLTHFSFLLLAFVFLLSLIAKKFYRLIMVLPFLSFGIFLIIDNNFVEVLYELSPLFIKERFLFSDRFFTPEDVGFPFSLLIFIIIFYMQFFLFPMTDNAIRSVFAFISVILSMYILFFDVFLLKRLFSVSIYLLLIPLVYNLKYCFSYKFLLFHVVIFLLLLTIFYGYIASEGGRHGGIPYHSIYWDVQ